MGLSFAQALGSAAGQWNEARAQKLKEQQDAAELELRKDTAARQLALQMKQYEIEKKRAEFEQGRMEMEPKLLEQRGWNKVGADYQLADGSWEAMYYNPVTNETRRIRTGTPKAAAIQDLKGDQALELEKQRNKDKLDQIAASGRWHVKWAEISSQGKLKKEDWNVLKTDPGYIGAIAGMKNALAERNMILARMYSTTNPPTVPQFEELNKQLQDVEGRLKQSSDTAEQVRNRVRFGPSAAATSQAISDLKQRVVTRTVRVHGQSIPVMADGTFMYNGQKYKVDATGDGGTLVENLSHGQ